MVGQGCLGWARVLFAEGPRVVVNTLTLVSVIHADLIPDHEAEALRARLPNRLVKIFWWGN